MSYLTSSFIIAMLLALSVHEAAHGFVAYWLGDPTAKYQGRLSLNPLRHLDPLGTVMFLFAGFGWGKPVPVDPRYFKHWKRDTALVSAAGPVSNLLLALIAAGIFAVLTRTGYASMPFAVGLFSDMIVLNLSLMAFNLLPIAPLDGSKILQPFIPLEFEDGYDQLMHYGPYILLGLLVAERVFNVPLLGWWIQLIADPVLHALQSVL